MAVLCGMSHTHPFPGNPVFGNPVFGNPVFGNPVFGTPVFEGIDLTCIRGERLVFSGVGFSLAPGEALLLIGPNGSGKSSLLRLMAGLGRPAGGQVTWDGKDIAVDAPGHHHRLHYLGHQDAVKPALTVAETIRFWAGLQSSPNGTASADAALVRFRLDKLGETPCRFLSAGQRRRLALCRLAAYPAPLWLLDEPTLGLDRAALGDLEALLAEHRAGGGLVVLSTHTPLALPGARELSLG
jgi:heme exporter protein A